MVTQQDILNFNVDDLDNQDYRNLFKEAQNEIRLLQVNYDDQREQFLTEYNSAKDMAGQIAALTEEVARLKEKAEDNTTILIRKMVQDQVDAVLQSADMARRIEETTENIVEMFIDNYDLGDKVTAAIESAVEDYDFEDAAKDKLQEAVEECRIEIRSGRW